MSTAKEEILGRICDAVGGTSSVSSAYRDSVARRYAMAAKLEQAGRIDLFVDRLHDYDASVRRCSADGVQTAVREALEARGKRRIVIPPGCPQDWLPAGFEFLRDNHLSYDELNRSEGVLTGCALAIAWTGTIVLRHSAAEGRRALSLIPDYFLCVVREDQIVETVPEAIEQMASFCDVPVTTISGPSATSDIEMTRIKGVHGPRTLEVILSSSVNVH